MKNWSWCNFYRERWNQSSQLEHLLILEFSQMAWYMVPGLAITILRKLGILPNHMRPLSHGEAYLPPNKCKGATPFNRLASVHPSCAYDPTTASRYLSWFPSSEPAPSSTKFPQTSGKQTEVEKEMKQVNRKLKLTSALLT